MASAQKQFANDSKDAEWTEEKIVPVDITNLILEYDGFFIKETVRESAPWGVFTNPLQSA